MVRDDMDAVLFWDAWPSSGESAPRQGDVSEMSELRRRQRLAEATLPFRGGRIRFSANDTAFSAQSGEALSAVLAELRRDPTLNLLVKAFADARETNRVQLSLGRARAVVAWLTERGVNAERLAPIGCGAARALWVGATEEQRAANRRAELVRNSPSEGCVPPRSFALP
jgi:outer membrane protein OmpA-like peptidoglycan-associated protein